MDETWILQGREITSKDIDCIRRLMVENPAFKRTRLSQEICQLWNWKNTQGQIKDMACRTLLLKLEKKGLYEEDRQADRQRAHPRRREGIHVRRVFEHARSREAAEVVH